MSFNLKILNHQNKISKVVSRHADLGEEQLDELEDSKQNIM